MFSLFRRKTESFFSQDDKNMIVQAIRTAELNTSGEIRVYIESRCRFVDPLDRAVEVFQLLQMQQTAQRNAVLVYIALRDRQLAVYADEGIFRKAGTAFWDESVKKILAEFNREHYVSGIAAMVLEIGQVLSSHFPYDAATDKNELPDDIVFGN